MLNYTLCYEDLTIELTEVYTAIGYPDEVQIDEATKKEVSSILVEISDNLEPSIAFVTTSIDKLADFNPGKIIMNQLRGSEALCWFVVTAGQWFESFQQRLMAEGDMLRVYIANEIGSIIAEKTADHMERLLEQQIFPKQLHHTNRFSPGYCNWPLTDQQKLFKLLGTNPCGVSLSDSCLMTPIKSVSGIIGIGHNVKKHDYQCNICGLESCYKRKIGIRN